MIDCNKTTFWSFAAINYGKIMKINKIIYFLYYNHKILIFKT